MLEMPKNRTDVQLHACEERLCKSCAKYNDSCIQHKVFPRWDLVVTGVYPTIPGDHVSACVTDSQGVPPATLLAPAIEQTTDDGSSHNTPQFVLDDLLKCDKTRCHDIFVDQMVHIFQYGMKDILETLSALDMDVLSTINSTLVERAKVSFPQFKDRG